MSIEIANKATSPDEFLLKKTRISVTDKRFFTGVVTCYDFDGNVIIMDVIETRPEGLMGFEGRDKYFGMCMIPFQHIVTFEQLVEEEQPKLD